MKYFRVDYGFNGNQIIPIDETELEKAIYAHITGKTVVFNNGSVRGDKIIAIAPDFHRELGYGYNHKLDGYDWKDLAPVERKYAGLIGHTKERVQYLIVNGKEALIGQNTPIPELERSKQPDARVGGGMKRIGDLPHGV